MVAQLRKNELIINDGNFHRFIGDSDVLGGNFGKRGLVPADLATCPVASMKGASPFDLSFKVIEDTTQIIDMCKEITNSQARLSDNRRRYVSGSPIPSLDQNGQGFCWNYSVTMTVMMTRMKMRLPYVRLSGHANACMIKNFRDEGGWCGLSMERQTSHGSPSIEFWAEKSMSRSNDNPKTWENAALHKVSEGWVDLRSPVYDRNMTFKQVLTLLLCGIPVAADYNWWGHSVCLLDVVLVENGSLGVRGINSWTDGWGNLGEFVLQGDKAVPDSAVAPRTIYASAA